MNVKSTQLWNRYMQIQTMPNNITLNRVFLKDINDMKMNEGKFSHDKLFNISIFVLLTLKINTVLANIRSLKKF